MAIRMPPKRFWVVATAVSRNFTVHHKMSLQFYQKLISLYISFKRLSLRYAMYVYRCPPMLGGNKKEKANYEKIASL